MKIALAAPLYESVPPRMYGGTERVVSYLTEELVRLNHDVTLFASGDSVTRAKLVPVVPQSLRLAQCIDPIPAHILMLNRVAQAADDFDLIHFHIDYLHFLISRVLRLPHVTTLHGRLDLPELQALYREYQDMPLVSISNHQRAPLPFAQWVATVPHGLPEQLYSFHPGAGKYLAFLGRISPEKGVDRAIEIARRVGMELWIAAKVDRAEESYFKQHVRPLLCDPLIRFVGEIGERDKGQFLGDARALLFPIDWPEPFGLVLIEAMACGTPVIAFRHGSVPEVINDTETGFIVSTIDEAVAAVEDIATFDRQRCRHVFEQRFTAGRMAQDYLAVYRQLASEQPSWRIA